MQTFRTRIGELLIGITAICIPIVIFSIVWEDINIPQKRIYVFYEVDDSVIKIPAKKHTEFETSTPDAKILLTYKDNEYGVPLKDKDRFIRKLGVKNVTLSVYDKDENYILEQSKAHTVPGY